MFYFIARSIGKIGGASLGAYMGKSPAILKKYIGFTLLPQVGVALALALSIKKDFTQKIIENGVEVLKYGKEGEHVAFIVINVLLFTTILTEIVGPICTRTVLKKAGEITDERGGN